MQRLEHKWKVLISVIFGVFMVILDTTVVNVAFPTLRREYHASLADAQWILSVYVLALGIATPLAGFLADRYGVKRVYVTGLSGFVIGSFLCGLAPSLWLLVAARAMQGLSGGIAIPLGSAQLLRTFPANEQGKALGLFGIALVVAPALGPILGGYLVDAGMWRWIFFINIPIGALGVFLASRSLPGGGTARRHVLDWLGLITEVIGFGSILYAASIAESHGWTAPETIIWFAIGTVGLAAFVLVELFVAREPLLDFRLFRSRTFTLATLVGYASVLGLFGAEFLMPVYLQALRGKTALETGFILLPLAISAGIATPIAGRLYDRIGPRPLLIAGFALLVMNTWQLSEITATTPVRWLLVLLVLRGLALGMTVQTTFVTALSVVSAANLPRGSSLVNSLRQVVQSLGVALLATVLASAQSPAIRAFQQRAQEEVRPSASGARFALCTAPVVPTIATAAAPAEAAAGAGQMPERIATLMRSACAQSVRGFERAYRFTMYMAMVAFLLGIFMPGWPGRWTGRKSNAHPQPVPEPTLA